MNVKEVIESLQKLPQDLPVYYVMFDDGYNVVKLTPEDIIKTVLEDEHGKEFDCIVFGEGWLL